MKTPKFAMLVLFTMIFIPQESRAEWQRVRSVEHVVVDTSPVPGRSFENIRGRVTINAPLEKVLAVYNDRNKLVNWIHRLVQFKDLGGNEKAFSLYLRFDMPVGLADRDVVVNFKSRKDGNGGIIYEGKLQKEGGGQAGATAMKQFHSTWHFEPKGAHTRLTYQQYSDPDMMLPTAVVMPVAIDMVLNTMIKLNKAIEAR